MAHKGRGSLYGFLVSPVPLVASFLALPLIAVDYSCPVNTLIILAAGATGLALPVVYFARTEFGSVLARQGPQAA